MAITIERIKQRMIDLYSSEFGADVILPAAISYLIKRRNDVIEYLEYARAFKTSPDNAPPRPNGLWIAYERDLFLHPQEITDKNGQKRIVVSEYVPVEFDPDLLSPPLMIEYAIDTLVEEEQLDASFNVKAEPDKPFELKGQTMCFGDGTRELLTDTEAKFVEIVIEKSKRGLVADEDAFRDSTIHGRRAVIRAEIKKKHPRTSGLIRSKRGQKGYCIPELFPTSSK